MLDSFSNRQYVDQRPNQAPSPNFQTALSSQRDSLHLVKESSVEPTWEHHTSRDSLNQRASMPSSSFPIMQQQPTPPVSVQIQPPQNVKRMLISHGMAPAQASQYTLPNFGQQVPIEKDQFQQLQQQPEISQQQHSMNLGMQGNFQYNGNLSKEQSLDLLDQGTPPQQSSDYHQQFSNEFYIHEPSAPSYRPFESSNTTPNPYIQIENQEGSRGGYPLNAGDSVRQQEDFQLVSRQLLKQNQNPVANKTRKTYLPHDSGHPHAGHREFSSMPPARTIGQPSARVPSYPIPPQKSQPRLADQPPLIYQPPCDIVVEKAPKVIPYNNNGGLTYFKPGQPISLTAGAHNTTEQSHRNSLYGFDNQGSVGRGRLNQQSIRDSNHSNQSNKFSYYDSSPVVKSKQASVRSSSAINQNSLSKSRNPQRPLQPNLRAVRSSGTSGKIMGRSPNGNVIPVAALIDTNEKLVDDKFYSKDLIPSYKVDEDEAEPLAPEILQAQKENYVKQFLDKEKKKQRYFDPRESRLSLQQLWVNQHSEQKKQPTIGEGLQDPLDMGSPGFEISNTKTSQDPKIIGESGGDDEIMKPSVHPKISLIQELSAQQMRDKIAERNQGIEDHPILQSEDYKKWIREKANQFRFEEKQNQEYEQIAELVDQYIKETQCLSEKGVGLRRQLYDLTRGDVDRAFTKSDFEKQYSYDLAGTASRSRRSPTRGSPQRASPDAPAGVRTVDERQRGIPSLYDNNELLQHQKVEKLNTLVNPRLTTQKTAEVLYTRRRGDSSRVPDYPPLQDSTISRGLTEPTMADAEMYKYLREQAPRVPLKQRVLEYAANPNSYAARPKQFVPNKLQTLRDQLKARGQLGPTQDSAKMTFSPAIIPDQPTTKQTISSSIAVGGSGIGSKSLQQASRQGARPHSSNPASRSGFSSHMKKNYESLTKRSVGQHLQQAQFERSSPSYLRRSSPPKSSSGYRGGQRADSSDSKSRLSSTMQSRRMKASKLGKFLEGVRRMIGSQRYDLGKKATEKAIQQRTFGEIPKDPKIYLYCGICNLELGYLIIAEQMLQKCMMHAQLCENSPLKETKQFEYPRVFELANRFYHQVLSANKNGKDTDRNFFGQLIARQKDFEEGVIFLSMALDMAKVRKKQTSIDPGTLTDQFLGAQGSL